MILFFSWSSVKQILHIFTITILFLYLCLSNRLGRRHYVFCPSVYMYMVAPQNLRKFVTISMQALTHTHMFNGPLSGTTQVSWYQKGKTNLDFTEARDSEWQWHQLGHMQVCTSLQTDNHANTPPLSFLQARCRSCHPTNSVKALKGISIYHIDATSQNLVKMFLEFLKIKIRLQFLCSCLFRQFTVIG